MQKIDTVAEPQINKYYLVAHAHLTGGSIVPILPLLHRDKEFAPMVGKHYHLDTRFKIRKKGEDEIGDSYNYILHEKNNVIIHIENVVNVHYHKRLLTSSNIGGLFSPHEYEIYKTWAKKQIGKSCKGGICPHLKVQMIKRGEHWICPMHNLVGCVESEEIIGVDSYGCIHDLPTNDLAAKPNHLLVKSKIDEYAAR